MSKLSSRVHIISAKPSATARFLACALSDCAIEVRLVERLANKSSGKSSSKSGALALALNPKTLASLACHQITIEEAHPIDHIKLYAGGHGGGGQGSEAGGIFEPPFHIDKKDLDDNADNLGVIIQEKALIDILGKACAKRDIIIEPDIDQKLDTKTDFRIFCDHAKAKPYGQKALCAVLAHKGKPHQAEQIFYPSGPLALLPLEEGRSALIWTRPTKVAQDLLSLSPKRFLTFLHDYLPQDKKQCQLDSAISSYDLGFFFAHDWYDERQNLLLIGQAAHIAHPLAGQGWNICAEDVYSLAQSVAKAHHLGLDAFSPIMMAEYQKSRRARAGTLVYMIDLLARFPMLSHKMAASGFDFLSISKPMRGFLAKAGAGYGFEKGFEILR